MYKNKTKIWVTIGAFIIGLLIHFFAIKGILYSQNLHFNWSNFAKLHSKVIFYFIDAIPFIFALFAYIITQTYVVIIKKLKNDLNQRIKRQSKVIEITKKLSEGVIDIEINQTQDDELTKHIIVLKNSISNKQKEEDKRKEEDARRHWVAEGLAKFGEILRQNNDDINTLSYDIISELCKYLDTVQGGFYILDDSEKTDLHFELTAHFAYNRRKYSQKRVELKEGLIGRAAFEQKTLNIDEVPQDYLEVTSGLGVANPTNLLIVPLKFNDQVHGVIEIAGFNKFTDYIVDFVEKIAESIASTIGNVKINVMTAKLLKDSQEQAERMSQQEEEMRQNMEELQATQEEAHKQSKEFISFTNSVNHTLIRAEYDINGVLIYANTKFLNKLQYPNSKEVEGHHISMFINEEDKKWFNDIWSSIVNGEKHFEGYMRHLTKNTTDLWTIATYTSLKNENDEIEKILFLAIDITKEKEKDLYLQEKIKTYENNSLEAEYSPSGTLISHNQIFAETTEYSQEELVNKNIFDFFDKEKSAAFEEIWNNISEGNTYKGEVEFMTKNNERRYVQAIISPIKSLNNLDTRILITGFEITHLRELEATTTKQEQELLDTKSKLAKLEIDNQTNIEQTKKELKNQYKRTEKQKLFLEKVIDSSIDPIFIFNQNNIIEHVNKAASELIGINKEELIESDIKKLFSQETLNKNKYIQTITNTDKTSILDKRESIQISLKNSKNINVKVLLSKTIIDRVTIYSLQMEL